MAEIELRFIERKEIIAADGRIVTSRILQQRKACIQIDKDGSEYPGWRGWRDVPFVEPSDSTQ